METTPRLDDVEKSSRHPRASASESAVEVDQFFAALRAAQAGFMDVIWRAQAQLGRNSGQLSHVAAIQGRLTRQFFDAQRSIMMRRAEIDAEVALIGSAAEAQADELVSAARVRAVAYGTHERSAAPMARRCVPRPDVVVIETGADADVAVRSPRQQIAALGAEVVRTMADADSLSRVIDDAFEPDEPDGAAAERQLSQLLDAWWRAENQEGRAIVDDANARAAMRHHVAGIEASEIAPEPAATTDTSEPQAAEHLVDLADPAVLVDADDDAVSRAAYVSTHLPEQMLAALDTADPAGLQSLLVALAASLDLEPVGNVMAEAATSTVVVERPREDLVIRADRVEAVDRFEAHAPDEVFRAFWVKAPTPDVEKSGWSWIPVHVVLPMMAVTFALALLLAWIG